MKRDRSCQYPYCIKTALTVPCTDCKLWLCQAHFLKKAHSCKKLSTWQTSSPTLNAIPNLEPDELKAGKDGVPRLHVAIPLPDMEIVESTRKEGTGKKKIRRKDWLQMIGK